MYDHENKEKNMEAYGEEAPPELDVSKITDIPVAMFSGKYDKIVNIEENREQAKKIPGVMVLDELEADHLSVLVGKDMSYMMNVLQLLGDKNPLNYDREAVFPTSPSTPPSKTEQEEIS